MKQYEAFCYWFSILEKAPGEDYSNDFVVDGCFFIFGQCFSFACNLLESLMKFDGVLSSNEHALPKAALNIACCYYGFIDVNVWLSMLKDRNSNVHIYDNKLALELIGRILYEYTPVFQQLKAGLDAHYGDKLLLPDDELL